MRFNHFKAILKASVRGAAVLLLGAGLANAQQQINLTAGPATATLPDGSSVPMWGYTLRHPGVWFDCHLRRAHSAASGSWSPVIISVPTGQDLQINLTNALPAPGTHIAGDCGTTGRRSWEM